MIMNMLDIMNIYRIKTLTFLLVMALLTLSGCSKSEEPDNRETEYGYVQFKVYKAGTKAEEIEYLHDIGKIKITMYSGENMISQTLVMNSYDDETAEYGIRSGRLKLLAGDYEVNRFTLYDKLDNPVYNGMPSEEASVFNVVPGGLVVYDLFADVVARGKVRFSLVKDMSDFKDIPSVKSPTRQYTFDEAAYVTLILSRDNRPDTLSMIPTEFSVHFEENDDPTDGYQTSSMVCDTLFTMRAGEYRIKSYSVFDAGKRLLEFKSDVNASFVVADNELTEADVPVTLYETDEYIKDYYALYQIWQSLNGKDWYYRGEDYSTGMNWNFNKDPDLWGSQPGVSLHSNGRVAVLNLSGFGFYGHMSEALGQLTELEQLNLGTHNDFNQSAYDPHTVTQMSEPIARALAENGITIPETALYDSMSESQIIEAGTGDTRIQPMDVVHGKLNNGLKSLPTTIGALTKLSSLYIANGELESLPDEMANLVSCEDLEIYNCPKMSEFPAVIARMPALESINLANNRQWSASEALEGIKALASGPSRESIEILYFNENNLEIIPKEICNMKKLGLIDFASNNISEIETAWGNDIKPIQLYLDDNHLSSFPVDENGVFCYMEDAETFSVKNNEFTEFPNIFDSGSMFAIVSIDFSYNHISSFPSDFKGVYVETLTIANNPELTRYPLELAKSNSKIMNINFRGCNISEIPEGAFEYENSIYLSSLDLSYNDLTDLPHEMNAVNMPYLYGVELSYNRFSSFPWEPLDSQYLTVFAIRGQRDAEGRRCLSEWPEGIYNHRGLRGFYIGSNNLGKIDDTISTLCYYLDISDNPNIVFDASDICYAYQQGAYILIYDKTQNIRNCEIMLQ